MSKAEEIHYKAVIAADNQEPPKDYCISAHADHFNGFVEGYVEGYHQAEKDLELTWENMFDIFRLVNEVLDDFAEGKTKKEVGEEVLKRFKDLKKGKRNENVHN
jgi:hypothetical protein